MTEERRKNIAETGMLTGCDRIVCGLSGGADSVFLLLELERVAAETGRLLKAVHVHHGIRGAEADRDAAFAEALCRRLRIPIVTVRREIPREAVERGISLEEAGRNARREILLREAKAWGGVPAIALAHHRDDLAESVLFRAARGTGIRGLAAMEPVSELQGVRVIRPLLSLPKSAICEELRRRGESWVEDSTNAETEAVRNRIRLKILPLLEEEVNAGASAHLASLAADAAAVSDFLRAEGLRRKDRYLTGSALYGEGLLIREALMTEEMPAMQAELLHMALSARLPSMRDVGRVHLKGLVELFSMETGKRLTLPGGLRALRVPEGILLESGNPPAEEEPVRLLPGESALFKNVRYDAAFETSLPPDLTEKKYTKTIDYGKISGTLVIRTRREGDYLTVRKDGARRSLSDFFTDRKIPRSVRDEIPLLADGREIVWVVGMRLGYRYRVTEDTVKALTIRAGGIRDE